MKGQSRRYSGRKIKRRINSSDPQRKRPFFTRNERLRIYAAYQAGFPTMRVADILGIPLSRLEKAISNGRDPMERVYHDFRRQIKRIKGKHEKTALKIIRDVVKGGGKITERKMTIKSSGVGKHKIENQEIQTSIKEKGPVWQAAAWILERAYKDYSLLGKYDMPDKSIEDIAKDVKNAADKLFSSIPSLPEEVSI